MSIINVKVYTKPDCELCLPFIKTIQKICAKNKWKPITHLQIIDINSSPELHKEYQIKIPACTINDRLVFKYKIKSLELEKLLAHEALSIPLL